MAFSLLDRYIFCEFVQVMLVGSVIVLGVWFTTDELQMIFSLITTAGVSFEDAMLLLVLHLPKVIAFNMPAAVCIGAVLIFSRLARDSELTTLRLSGVSVQRILLTPVCIGVLAALTSFWLNECVVPVATRTFKSFLAMAVCSTRINSGRTAYTFEEYSKDSQLKRLFLMPFNETKGVSQAVVLNFIDGEVTSIVTSNSLTRDHNRWVLDEGHAYELLCRSGFTHKLDFAKLVLAGVRSQLVTFGPAQTSSSDADFWQLQQYISHLKNSENAIPAPLLFRMHQKLSRPVACLILILAVSPIGLLGHRTGNTIGLLYGSLVIVLYYLLQSSCDVLGEAGHLEPLLSAWLPSLILSGLTLAVLYSRLK